MGEEWRPIPGYEDYYEASNRGRIRSIEREQIGRWGTVHHYPHIMSQNNVHNGYMQVKFSVEGVKSQQLVHRLVALAFIPNPKNLPQVNHKDGNPKNNDPDNLEWCTVSENALHRCRVLNKRVGRPYKPVVCLDTGEVFESSHHASRAMNIGQGSIFSVCQGKQQLAGGLRFAFAQ